MTAMRQDFTTYAGDAISPQFTVLDASGAPVDISTASNITFAARRSLSDPVILIKTKLAGGITFVTSGADGKFQVLLLATDTTPLTGFYLYQCVVIDNTGNPTTVTIGRMQVGAAPAWTYSGDPASNQKDSVRFLIGDTQSADQQFFDPEILFALTIRPSIYGAASDLCRSLAARLSRTADTVQGDMHVMYANRSKQYFRMAVDYDRIAAARSGALPYAGGISVSDKVLIESDNDRVAPQYVLGMQDNWLPVGSAGNETQTNTPPTVPF